MKWLRTIIVFDKGGVLASEDWKNLHEAYVEAIKKIKHPVGSDKFTIRKKIKLEKKSKDQTQQWKRNGVQYIRKEFLNHLIEDGVWKKEEKIAFDKKDVSVSLKLYPSGEAYEEPVTADFGEFDFISTGKINNVKIALEWETGNISSSHRSVNKLCVCLNAGIIQAGVVIVPSRLFYEHLTDRIGNINELPGYLSLWESAKHRVEKGLLAITVVEHDELTEDEKIPFLHVGKDGRAIKEPKAS